MKVNMRGEVPRGSRMSPDYLLLFITCYRTYLLSAIYHWVLYHWVLKNNKSIYTSDDKSSMKEGFSPDVVASFLLTLPCCTCPNNESGTGLNLNSLP